MGRGLRTTFFDPDSARLRRVDVRIIREATSPGTIEAVPIMKKFLPGAVSRRLMAAVVAGTALSALGGDARAASPPLADQAIQDISRYCQVCWRNARLHPDSWTDATQEVLVRLLQT